MYTFIINTSRGFLLYHLGLVMLIVAVVSLITGARLYYMKNRTGNGGRTHLAFLIVFIILIAPGATFFLLHPTNSQVTIGAHYISVDSKYFGNRTYTTTQIQKAFLDNMQNGSLTYTGKVSGSGGAGIAVNNGIFKLSNGAKAYVATTSFNVLVIEPHSGDYIIVGNSNTSALAAAFQKDVASVG